MINYINHKNIDKQKWDACIKASVNSSVFAYSWYLDTVCDAWDALVLNDYEAVFPIVHNSKLGIKYIYQPNFTRYFGVYSKNELTQQLVQDFFDAVPKHFRYIEFSIHEKNSSNLLDYQKKEKLYQQLDIRADYNSLFLNFKGDAKRNIKKAEKHNLLITENVSGKQVVELFKNNKGKELKSLADKDYFQLEKLMNVAIQKKSAFIVGILNSEKMLIAAGCFVFCDNTILFLKGSANAEGKSTGAMYLVLNYVFKKYAGNNYLFDFGGSSVETVANFNHNFGAKDCVYLQVKKNNLPWLLKLMSGKK